MSIELLTLVLFASFFLLLATGFPIAWTLGGIGMVFTLFFLGPNNFSTAAMGAWNMMMSFTLLSIPLVLFL